MNEAAQQRDQTEVRFCERHYNLGCSTSNLDTVEGKVGLVRYMNPPYDKAKLCVLL